MNKINKNNLYENTLENLVKYYAECRHQMTLHSCQASGYYHSPKEVMEVILDKFEPKVR